MIELIFAIVIMGIVLLSAPLILSQSTKSNMTAFQQESIAIAAAHANSLMSYTWDEQNTGDGKAANKILTVTNDIPALNEGNLSLRGTTGSTAGTQITLAGQRERRFSLVATNATFPLASEAGDRDDIDDFNNVDSNLTLYGSENAANKGAYINQTIKIKTTVAYAQSVFGTNNFTFSEPFTKVTGGSSNIKRITVTLSGNSNSAELNATQIVLHSFMCNIGAANPRTRSGI